MKTYLILPFTLLLFSCFSPAKEEKQEKQTPSHDNIVRIGEAIQNRKEVKLSELVDKIELVPLETNTHCMLRDHWWYTQTPPYICVSGDLFDYKGKHRFKIGRVGQGPCEEFYEPIDVLYHPVHDKFSTKGSKIILYDGQGNCTGVTRQVLIIEKHKKEKAVGRKLGVMAVAGENYVINNNIDSLLWIDVNLKDIKSRAVPRAGNISGLCSKQSQTYRQFTTHKDSTLFYNYWNDTIYRVTSTNIEPRWIIDLGKEKISEDVRTRYRQIMKDQDKEFFGAIQTGRKPDLENTEAVLLTKDNKAIWSVHETDNFLFFIWSKVSPQNEARGITDFYNQVGYYNKHTGETVAVKGRGFVDDIFFTGDYMPYAGMFDNKFMKVVWPYELAELIEEKQGNGEKVHPKLLELSKKMSDEDNPFLMVAHLKRIK